MQPQTAKAPDVSVQDLADTTHVDSENAAYKNADGLSWGRTEESRRDHSENRINRLPKRSSLFARQAHDLGRAFARAFMASSSDCRLPGKDHLSRLDETVRVKVFFLELGDGFPPILFWIARLAQTGNSTDYDVILFVTNDDVDIVLPLEGLTLVHFNCLFHALLLSVRVLIPGASRPSFRNDVAHHSEIIPPTVPR